MVFTNQESKCVNIKKYCILEVKSIKDRNIKIIQQEISPIRNLIYRRNYKITLSYFQFENKFSKKYCENLYKEFLAFAFCVALLVVLTHRKNIQRLFDGSEGKAKILKRHYVEDGSKSGSFFRRRN